MRRTTRDLSIANQGGLAAGQHFDDIVRHIVFCVFNRATYSRIKSLLLDIEKTKGFKSTVLCASGLIEEKHGRAVEYIKKDLKNTQVIEIDAKAPDSSHLGSAIGCAEILHKYAEWFQANINDITAVVVTADRFETLGAAIAASYLNIPLIHIQGGEITGNIDEKVRHSVTKLSDYHFVATDLAKKYLVRMGEDYWRVFKTGCPSLDVLKRAGIERIKPIEKYIICQFHPETENPEEAASQTEVIMRAIVEFCAKEAHHAYVYWPNPDPGRERVVEVLETYHKANKHLLYKAKNKEPEKFLWQLAGASFLIGNSSCGIRECSYLGLPAINVGDRQAHRERSLNVHDVGYDFDQIMKAIYEQYYIGRYHRTYLYGGGDSAVEIIDRLFRIDFSLKPPLQYPNLSEYKEAHFGEQRFKRYSKNRVENT